MIPNSVPPSSSCDHPRWNKPVKLTDDVTQREKEEKKSNNNLTLPRANKTKKKFHRFLHRGKSMATVQLCMISFNPRSFPCSQRLFYLLFLRRSLVCRTSSFCWEQDGESGGDALYRPLRPRLYQWQRLPPIDRKITYVSLIIVCSVLQRNYVPKWLTADHQSCWWDIYLLS